MKTLMLLCSLFTVVPAATLNGKVLGVKIHGIDCEAKTFAAGKAARRYIADQAFMNDVKVEITGTESDGNLVGKVILGDGTDLGVDLIKGGLVWWDKQKMPDEAGLAESEKSARDAYLGIWAGAQDDDEQDFGKEVIAKRESAKDETAILTSANN